MANWPCLVESNLEQVIEQGMQRVCVIFVLVFMKFILTACFILLLVVPKESKAYGFAS